MITIEVTIKGTRPKNADKKEFSQFHSCCHKAHTDRSMESKPLTFWRRNYFINFSTPCIQNVNNTGTKHVRIMKQTAF